MWTDTTRAQYARSGLALPSDLTDGEWGLLEPFFPPPSLVGRPRKWPMRRIVEAMLYLLRGGLPWRMLPPGFLKFANDPSALWSGNFRDLAASVTRMATLSPEGRIGRETVDLEIMKLDRLWQGGNVAAGDGLEILFSEEKLDTLDPFDRVQLAEVIRVSRESRSMSEAGRTLFASSRKRRKTANDADRLKKYLARFHLTWAEISAES